MEKGGAAQHISRGVEKADQQHVAGVVRFYGAKNPPAAEKEKYGQRDAEADAGIQEGRQGFTADFDHGIADAPQDAAEKRAEFVKQRTSFFTGHKKPPFSRQ